MSVVVCRIRPSIHAAFQARAETVGATIDAVYDKLNGTENAVSAALVHGVAARLTPVIDAMGGGRADWLRDYRVRILDCNHLPGYLISGSDEMFSIGFQPFFRDLLGRSINAHGCILPIEARSGRPIEGEAFRFPLKSRGVDFPKTTVHF